MHTYLIEPLAPLVFRSGKPFGTESGVETGNFPLPSSLAGLLRTCHADEQGKQFSEALRKDITTAGPLLARRDLETGELTVLFPKPADAFYLKDPQSGKTRLIRLAPQKLPEDCGCDLPNGLLLPVQMNERPDGKPAPGAQFWPFDLLKRWGNVEELTFDELEKVGVCNPDTETRTHVALNDKTLANEAGQLFQTGALDLSARRKKENGMPTGWQKRDLVFIGRSDKKPELQGGLVNFGGERRLSRLSKLDAAQGDAWPSLPPDLGKNIRNEGGLRLTVVTPAIFAEGYLPGWLDKETLTGTPPGCPGLTLKLRAIAVKRWLAVSGWDLAERKPRPMRKAVAAGAVYWFEIKEAPPDFDIAAALWLKPLSDDEQDRRDGFGLALPAPWEPV